MEDDSLSAPLQAILTSQQTTFKNSNYRRKDHNSFNKSITYNFENAKLKWIVKKDSVYLTGNIQMFSPQRNEPQKPQYISLVRESVINNNKDLVNFTDSRGIISIENNLKAYPNPFTNNIIVDFELKKGSTVQTQLKTMDGKVVYTNNVTVKEAGHFTLPVQPRYIPAGTYLLSLQSDKLAKTIKVVKL